MSVDVVVGMLIAWAAGKTARVGRQFDRLTDDVIDGMAENVHSTVMGKLSTNAAVLQLLDEARATDGQVAAATRAAAMTAVTDATKRDPAFAAELRVASAPPGRRDEAGGNKGIQGVTVSNASNVRINNKVIDKIINQYHKSPVATVVVGLVLVGLLLFGASGAINALGDPVSDGTGAGPSTGIGPGPMPVPVTDSRAIVGIWSASDGTPAKRFTEAGSCTGFYYHNGKPLDIGGPMTCAISSKPDTQGRYTLIVTQSMNEATYSLVFTDADHAAVFDSNGNALYQLERF